MDRRYLIAGAATCLAAGIAIGWSIRTPRTEIAHEKASETVRVEYASAFDAREQWVLATEAESSSSAVTIAYRHTRTEPSGATEETSLDVTGTASQVKEATKGAGASTTTATEAEKGYVDRWHTKTVKVTTPDAKWALGPALGFSAKSGTLAGAHLTTPPLGPFQFSAIVAGNTGEASGFITGQLRF